MTSIPLTPRKGGLCIVASALKPADIIVSTTNAPLRFPLNGPQLMQDLGTIISGAIRADTRSPISHAMLYSGHGRVIEAIGDGVVERPLGQALQDATLAVAYRYKDLSDRQASTVITYARGKVGLKYDLDGALGGGARTNPAVCMAVIGALTSGNALTAYTVAKKVCDDAAAGKWQDPNKSYCSELVLESFQRAGIRVSSVSSSVSVPQDIVNAYNCGVLDYVGHLR
jgi:cell wall-associated NlpC family hydrolase